MEHFSVPRKIGGELERLPGIPGEKNLCTYQDTGLFISKATLVSRDGWWGRARFFNIVFGNWHSFLSAVLGV